MAWFNQGPKIGSDKGNTVLTAHTYHKGGALGNRLYDKNNGIKKGDIIRLTDKTGQTVCYRYDHDTKVMVKDYNPNSNILYDNNGPAQAAILSGSIISSKATLRRARTFSHFYSEAYEP